MKNAINNDVRLVHSVWLKRNSVVIYQPKYHAETTHNKAFRRNIIIITVCLKRKYVIKTRRRKQFKFVGEKLFENANINFPSPRRCFWRVSPIHYSLFQKHNVLFDTQVRTLPADPCISSHFFAKHFDLSRKFCARVLYEINFLYSNKIILMTGYD